MILRATFSLIMAAAFPLSASAEAAVPTYFPPAFAKRTISCQFPGPKPIVDDIEYRWYTRQLIAAREPSLYEASLRRSQNSIRFIWLRSFHKPIFVRVDRLRSASPLLVAKELSGMGGYDPGTRKSVIRRALSIGETKKIRSILAKTSVESMPPIDCAAGMDGAQWIIEAADRAGYHFVSRWSPTQGVVRELGLTLLALTSWTIEETEIY